MEGITDIRRYKSALRLKYKNWRSRLSSTRKLKLDEDILGRMLRLNQYAVADTVLTYVSKDREVDTRKLIARALKDGKRVAVPRCIPNTRKMNFYYISSIEELSIQSFGVLEPESNLKNLYNTADHSICFVPALCFDENGYRLGYGMGYYDRFLMGYSGLTIGLCYSECVRGHLQHGKFDRPVDIVITEKFIKRTSLNRR